LKVKVETLEKRLTQLLASISGKANEDDISINQEIPVEADEADEADETDEELEGLTRLYCEVTGRDKVPNNKKRDKQRIQEQIDKQKLLPDTNNE
jgi:hypothetical protein